MPPLFRVLPGLPPYGPLAIPFPADWGRSGREGFVVEFGFAERAWVGNFGPGIGGLNLAIHHPNGHDIIVIAGGELWVVDADIRSAELIAPAIEHAWDVREPDGIIMNRQGLAFIRIGPGGIAWHTRRLSWNGFNRLEISGDNLTGLAWAPPDSWRPFVVDLHTGRSTGGNYHGKDTEHWERLNEDAG